MVVMPTGVRFVHALPSDVGVVLQGIDPCRRRIGLDRSRDGLRLRFPVLLADTHGDAIGSRDGEWTGETALLFGGIHVTTMVLRLIGDVVFAEIAGVRITVRGGDEVDMTAADQGRAGVAVDIDGLIGLVAATGQHDDPCFALSQILSRFCPLRYLYLFMGAMAGRSAHVFIVLALNSPDTVLAG